MFQLNLDDSNLYKSDFLFLHFNFYVFFFAPVNNRKLVAFIIIINWSQRIIVWFQLASVIINISRRIHVIIKVLHLLFWITIFINDVFLSALYYLVLVKYYNLESISDEVNLLHHSVVFPSESSSKNSRRSNSHSQPLLPNR